MSGELSSHDVARTYKEFLDHFDHISQRIALREVVQSSTHLKKMLTNTKNSQRPPLAQHDHYDGIINAAALNVLKSFTPDQLITTESALKNAIAGVDEAGDKATIAALSEQVKTNLKDMDAQLAEGHSQRIATEKTDQESKPRNRLNL